MKPKNLLARSAIALAMGLAAASCAPEGQPVPLPPAPGAAPPSAARQPGDVGVTIIGGEAPIPVIPQAAANATMPGDIQLNFPATDLRVVAKAVLGDLLRVPYTVAPDAAGAVTLVTPAPIARQSVLPAFETALAQANFALVQQNGGFTIMTVEAARASGITGQTATGYSSEIVRLQFINAGELKKLLDSVLPNVVIAADPGANTLTIAGTAGQRASAREIVAQFDVNWLRSMTFGYYVPERTDARLIVPELEKLINAPDAPTRGLVRLIAMGRLNGIIAVSAQPQYLEDVRRWIEVLDREGVSDEPRLFVYRVQNGRSRDLAATIRRAFGQSGGDGGGSDSDPFGSADASASDATGSGRGEVSQAGSGADRPATADRDAPTGGGARGPQVSITSDEVNNAVVVFGTPRAYAVVEDALRRLDVPPFQVLIEAAITEVTLNDDLRYGVQWNFSTGDSNFALSEGTGPNPVRLFPGFSYFLSNSDITAALNALEERTNIKVVSAPKLVVLNNQTGVVPGRRPGADPDAVGDLGRESRRTDRQRDRISRHRRDPQGHPAGQRRRAGAARHRAGSERPLVAAHFGHQLADHLDPPRCHVDRGAGRPGGHPRRAVPRF